MHEAPLHWLPHGPRAADASAAVPLPRPPQRIALLGNPNCGKTALFNLLTGSRQKVANYAGVTVERKSGTASTPAQRQVEVLDLPGTYSLNANSSDEAVTRDVVTGRTDEPLPDLLVCVTDATKLRLNLQLVLEAQQLNLPMLLVLNMSDVARAEGIAIDVQALSKALGGMPVVEAVGVQSGGADALLTALDQPVVPVQPGARAWQAASLAEVRMRQQQVREILCRTVREPQRTTHTSDRIDRVVLHPVWGAAILVLTLFLVFQAVFSWAALPMELIENATAWAGDWVAQHMAEGMLRSLLVDGVIAGAGGVLVFLPQILILFFFILLLEDSGYLPRAAFLLDRWMGMVGLSGRSFIPLLSSFACAIPGIMATRSIGNWRDRYVTIMIAPLMTCSARLPVYALLIAAFIPARTVAGIFNLQGLVLLGLYVFAIVSGLLVAWVMRVSYRRQNAHATHVAPLLMELPAYRWPNVRSLVMGLYERGWLFVRKVGTLILALTVVLWFLSTYPGAPAGATEPAITYSVAGRLGHMLAYVLAPIGLNWPIAIALVPGMVAREVVVGALGTVYALSATGTDAATALAPLIAKDWSLATGLSLLVWFVFAPQCLSMLATARRETQSWRAVAVMTLYLFGMAYGASFITYRLTLLLS